LWLDRGELMMDGDAAEVTAAYKGGGRVNVGTT
jgi:ABC-type polysaccharide/polyol phosphate transport system ATPase subunit